MTVVEVRIDRAKSLTEDCGTGHNRWHPGIDAIARCRPSDSENGCKPPCQFGPTLLVLQR